MNDAKSALERDGFFAIPKALPAALVDEIAAHCAHLNLDGAGMRNLLKLSWVQETVCALRNNPMLKSLLESASVAVQCTLFDKNQHINWLVPFHQDLSIQARKTGAALQNGRWTVKEGESYVQPPAEILEKALAVRLHLDPTTTSNGPLRVVPGSHHYGRLPSAACAELAATSTPIVCTAQRGDVLLMRPLLLHASSKSLSGSRRRILHFLFASPEPPAGIGWRYII